MIYSININQVRSIEFGLNLQLGALMDLIGKTGIWAESIIVNGKTYYYLSAQKICNEYPIITTKKNTALILIKKLLNKELIEREIQNNKSYYRLTEKGLLFFKQGVEKNQEGCGKKSRPGVEKNQDNNITSNNNTKDNNIIIKKEEKEKKFLENFKNEILDKKEFLENLIKKHQLEEKELKSACQDFYLYWTEKSKTGKMRFEKEKFFDFKRRFGTFIRNGIEWGKIKAGQQQNGKTKVSKIVF